jgi:uncharacterized protein (DUF3820 family)
VNRDPVLPFGKYAGQNLSSLPGDYLVWMASRRALRGTRRELYREICRHAARYLEATVEQLEPGTGTGVKFLTAAELCAEHRE